MRTSLKFIAVPLVALSLAGISSTAMAADQSGSKQEFTGTSWARMESIANARMEMRAFERANSMKCTETFRGAYAIPMTGLWLAHVSATCAAVEA